MRAIALFPRDRQIRLVDIPSPSLARPTQVRLRVLEVWLEAPDHERLRAEHLRLLDLLADRVSFR